MELTCVEAMEKLALRHQRDTGREQRNPQARYYQLAQGRRKLDLVVAEWHEIILVWLESTKASRIPSSFVLVTTFVEETMTHDTDLYRFVVGWLKENPAPAEPEPSVVTAPRDRVAAAQQWFIRLDDQLSFSHPTAYSSSVVAKTAPHASKVEKKETARPGLPCGFCSGSHRTATCSRAKACPCGRGKHPLKLCRRKGIPPSQA